MENGAISSNVETNLAWFEGRGISRDVTESAPLALKSRVPTFVFKDEIGEIQYNKGRFENQDGSKSFKRDRSGVQTLPWNLHALNARFSSSVPLIVTEGEVDALSCLEVGHHAAISVPDGAQGGKEEVLEDGTIKIDPTNDGGLQWLWQDGQLHPLIAKFRQVIIATDGDEKGEHLAQQLVRRIGEVRCLRMKYPKGCKDLNETLLEIGSDDFLDWIYEKPTPVIRDSFLPFRKVPRTKPLVPHSTGWSCLDAHLQLTVPELFILTGPPNLGKSQFLRALLGNLAAIHEHKIAILDFEDGIDHYDSDLEKIYKWRIAGPQSKSNWKDRSFDEWVNEHFFLYDMSHERDEQDEDLAWLEDLIEQAAIRRNCDWIVIDPWNEIEHIWSGKDNISTYLNRALKRIKRLMRRYNIGIIIVAHPTKASGQEWSESTGLYGIEGGAAWNNKADHGVTIHLDPSDPASVRRVTVSKSRNWNLRGRPGGVAMIFNHVNAAWSEFSEGSQANVRTTVSTEEAKRPGSSVTIDGDTPDSL